MMVAAIHACARCEHGNATGRCAGKCACLADEKGRDTMTLIRLHECPLGKFPARGAGDLLKIVLDATGIGPLASKAIKKVTGKPCGCQKRQEALNNLLPIKTEAP